MKIIYTENPLASKILLTDIEKKELYYKVKINQMEELMSEAYFDITHHDWYNEKIKPRTTEELLELLTKRLDTKYYYADENEDGKCGLDKEVERQLSYIIPALEDDVHGGDCTCVAASCIKCYAEQFAGVHTIKGLGKHEASKIGGYFREGKSILEVIEALRTYKVKPFSGEETKYWNKETHDYHTPRWEQEAVNAYEWLKKYQMEHFSHLTPNEL
jgi:hypothetical protein